MVIKYKKSGKEEVIYSVGSKKFKTKAAAMKYAQKTGAKKIKRTVYGFTYGFKK